MTRFLPPQPSIEFLKNEAKELHRAHARRQPDGCPPLRHLRRFRVATDTQILNSEVSLTECQFALAMEYGFASWQALRRTVQGQRPDADYQAAAQSDALLLTGTPAGIAHTNRYAAAYCMALSYLGACVSKPPSACVGTTSSGSRLAAPPDVAAGLAEAEYPHRLLGAEAEADYETVLGDTGLAFILQADGLHRPHGASVPQLDIGWWPLDPWGAMARLDFLGRVHGASFRVLQTRHDDYREDPEQHYRTYHETDIIDSLRAGRPAIGTCGYDVYLIVGCDDGQPPLLGQLSCVASIDVQRMTRYAYDAIVLAGAARTIDRRIADAQALEFAVRLGRDEVDFSHLPGKWAGRRSWVLWAEQIADDDLCGPSFYHANVVGNLQQNRRGAVGYLRTMSRRHDAPAARNLIRAADLYTDVLEALSRADTSNDAFARALGRGALFALIHDLVELEAAAQAAMVDAASAM